MIRHGEKPSHGDTGVDAQGNANPCGLIPRGWERAGALVTLFAEGERLYFDTFSPYSRQFFAMLDKPDAVLFAGPGFPRGDRHR